MGGEIFVGVRDNKLGKPRETLILRWTNPIPDWFMDANFLDQGKGLDIFLKPAEDAGEWPNHVRKIEAAEYGVILADLIQRKIFSRNTFTMPGRLIVAAMHDSFKEEIKQVEELIRRGWVEEVWRGIAPDVWNGKTGKLNEKLTLETYESEIKNANNEDSMFWIGYTVFLSKSVFEIDHKFEMPSREEVEAWLKQNGWVSQVKA
jgi:hypothetical protein